MDAVKPIDTIALFPKLHGHLMSLLHGLSVEDWHYPTICKGWSVKDIVAHMADIDLRMLALYRDRYSPADSPAIDSYQSLVNYLNKLNNDWVQLARRFSPAILMDWLQETGPQLYRIYKALPPFENAVFSVAWAGEEISSNWFHIARQYTEVWHHQQQIRLAVGQTAPLMTAELYHPLLDTFVRAMPHTYRNIEAKEGTVVKLTITGSGGADWYLYKISKGWQLFTNTVNELPDTIITIGGEIAWRLFTKGISLQEALPHIIINGDQHLGKPVLGMLSVMA
jgi:uncharacterized protein (TIGR03083 family)